MELKPLKTIEGNIVDFTVDNLGNIYTISSNNQLKKLNANGEQIAVYNDIRRYGSIYSLDASNPLKLLLYHKNFGTIVILDRFLNVRNTVDLRKLNIFQVKAIGQSYDNGIWVYDEQEAKLKKLDDEGNLVSESADLRLLLDSLPSPVQIIDQDRLVHLYDPEKGLFVFDYYGAIKNKVPLTGWTDVHVINGSVIGRKDGMLMQYKPGSLSLQEQDLKQVLSSVSKVKISINTLYCLQKGLINVYSF
jgi:hypothetical protein